MKKQYDKHHIPLLLNFKDLVMLKLHHEYHISGIKNKKLLIQHISYFKIKQHVSSLTYELDLSPNMKIYSVISITNLEPVLLSEDSYKCSFDDHPPPVEDKYNIDKEWKSFYIKKLLNYCLHYYECDKKIIEYLVKWKDYRSEFNKWYEEDLLDSTIELMLEYKTCKNNDSKHISYFHKLLTIDNAESSKASTKQLIQKRGRASKKAKVGTLID